MLLLPVLLISEQLKDRYEIRDEPPPKGKDCNDYLMHVHDKRLYKTKGAKANELHNDPCREKHYGIYLMRQIHHTNLLRMHFQG